MDVIVHFLNGNNKSTENYYRVKDYRNDIIVQIDQLYYEVHFYAEDVTKYQINSDGFFTYPGLIILDEITNDKIFKAIENLIDMHYFDYFAGRNEIPVNDTFIDKMHSGDSTRSKVFEWDKYVLR